MITFCHTSHIKSIASLFLSFYVSIVTLNLPMFIYKYPVFPDLLFWIIELCKFTTSIKHTWGSLICITCDAKTELILIHRNVWNEYYLSKKRFFYFSSKEQFSEVCYFSIYVGKLIIKRHLHLITVSFLFYFIHLLL